MDKYMTEMDEAVQRGREGERRGADGRTISLTDVSGEVQTTAYAKVTSCAMGPLCPVPTENSTRCPSSSERYPSP